MAQKPEALEFDEDIRSAHRRSHSWDELKTRDLFQKKILNKSIGCEQSAGRSEFDRDLTHFHKALNC